MLKDIGLPGPVGYVLKRIMYGVCPSVEYGITYSQFKKAKCRKRSYFRVTCMELVIAAASNSRASSTPVLGLRGSFILQHFIFSVNERVTTKRITRKCATEYGLIQLSQRGEQWSQLKMVASLQAPYLSGNFLK
jgi:hypothetical protein